MEQKIYDCLYSHAKSDLENIVEVKTANINECITSETIPLISSNFFSCSGIVLYNGSTFALAHILNDYPPHNILDETIENLKKTSSLLKKKVRACVIVGAHFGDIQSYLVSKDIKPSENNYFFPKRLKGDYLKRDVIIFPETKEIRVYHENNFDGIKF
ncbi:MAG: hypothetical protein WC755_02235 [Candidatus Woesearchaeota archaeon]|jgi:hypothetical protein